MKRILVALFLLLSVAGYGQSLQIPPADTCEIKLRILADMMKQAQEDVAVILETDSILRREIGNYEVLILKMDERIKICDRKFELKTEQYGLLYGQYIDVLDDNMKLEKKLKRKNNLAIFGGGGMTLIAVGLGILILVR